MFKPEKPIQRPLLFAIHESMTGRRRRLTERIAIHSLVGGHLPQGSDRPVTTSRFDL